MCSVIIDLGMTPRPVEAVLPESPTVIVTDVFGASRIFFPSRLGLKA